MRINRFVAMSSGLSRRAADKVIADGRVLVDGRVVAIGQDVSGSEQVTLDGRRLQLSPHRTIMFNKPAGYVTSRAGQGSKTIYDLLPPELHDLKPVGRLDKASSGLLLLTSDGELAQRLTHPNFRKMKCYEITLDKPLSPAHWKHITQRGVMLDDGPSRLELRWLDKNDGLKWLATMYEGRNRQIRRTFAALGYRVVRLHRTRFGAYRLPEDLSPARYRAV